MPGYIHNSPKTDLHLTCRVFDKRRKQGVRGGDRRKSKQEGWMWARDNLFVSPKAYVDRMKEITDSVMSSGLI